MSLTLKRVEARGHKGAQWGLDISPTHTFVRAPNGAGKSRVVETLMMSVTGRHPTAGTGNTPTSSGEAILRQAVGDRVDATTIWATPDGTIRVTRTWTRETKRVKGEEVVTFPRGKVCVLTGGRCITDKEADGFIAATFGDAAIFDGELLIGAKSSSTSRRKLLFQYVQGAPWDAGRFWAEAAKFHLDENAVRSLFERNVIQESHAYRSLDGTDSMIEWLRTSHSALHAIANWDAAEVRNAEKGLAALESDPIDAHEVATLSAALDARKHLADEQRAAAAAATAAEAMALERAKATAAERSRLDERLAAVRVALRDADGVEATARLAELSDSLARIPLKDLEAAETAAVAHQDAAWANMATATAGRETADAALSVAVDAWTAARDRLGADESAAPRSPLAEAERFRDMLLGIVEAADRRFDDPQCPLCWTSFEAEAALGEHAAQISALEELEQQFSAHVQADKAEVARLEQQADGARHAAAKANAAERAARARLQEATGQNFAASGAKRGADKRAGHLRDAIAAISAESANPERVGQLRATAAVLAGELSALPAPSADVLSGARLAAARAAADAQIARSRVEEDEATRDLRAADRRLQKKQDAEAQRAKLLEAVEWAKKSEHAAKAFGPTGLQEAILVAGIAPFVDGVTAYLPPERSPLSVSLVDGRGNADCVFYVRSSGGQRVPTESLSGGEWEPVQAAILAGLRRHARCRWPGLILDRIETVSFASRQALFVALGQIPGQILVLGCPDSAECPEGWHVVDEGR